MSENPLNPSESEILESNFRKEIDKWNALGVNIASIPLDGGLLRLSLRVDALLHLMMEKGICVEQDFHDAFYKKSLEVLPTIRGDIEPQIAEAKLQAIKNGDLRKH